MVSSEAAAQRAEAPVRKARQREAEVIETPRLHVQAKRFETPEAATAARDTLASAGKSPQVDAYSLVDHTRSAWKGRPTPTTPIKAIVWPMQAQVRPADAPRRRRQPHQACWVVGTTMDASQWRDAEVMRAYKGQA